MTAPVPPRLGAQVMRAERLGAFHANRLSFARTLVRRMARERWRFEVVHRALDTEAHGELVYGISTPAGPLSFVAFSRPLDPGMRTDRVIAERWDVTFALVDGTVDAADIERLAAAVPLQEAGRCTARELVLSRANRSVRLFDHVVDCLAEGRQPAASALGSVGYLLRTTAVYGNGKFGIADFARLRARGLFTLPFQAEMLTVYLARVLSVDLVEHAARSRSPAHAVALDPMLARGIGVGNATGLGMAPFLVTHPRLLAAWISTRERALARVRSVDRAGPGRLARFRELLDRARRHVNQWRTEDPEQGARVATLAVELEALTEWGAPAGDRPWDRLYRQVEDTTSIECQELVAALLLELYPERVDPLEVETVADDEPPSAPVMTVDVLIAHLEAHYAWAIGRDYSDADECHYFWYVSEEKAEPRLGVRDEDDGAELELPLDVARQVAALHAALVGASSIDRAGSVARFLVGAPRWRGVVRRVLAVGAEPYAEIRSNLLARTSRPIDLLRCKLATFGATRFDPKSLLWTRITLFQGAPLPGELDDPAVADDWWLPVMSDAA